MTTPETDNLQIIAQRAAEEHDRVEKYKNDIYAISFPEPEVQPISFIREYGLESVIHLVASIGALLWSGIRTATVFYIAEIALLTSFNISLNIGMLELLMPIAATFAFEGILAADGFSIGKSKGGISLWARIISGGVIMLAGLISSFGIVGVASTTSPVQLYLYWAFAVLSGIGAPIILFYATKNLGILGEKWELKKKENLDDYWVRKDAWDVAALESYKANRGEVFRGALKFEPKTESGEPIIKAPKPKPIKDDNAVAAKVRQWMLANNIRITDVGEGHSWPPSRIRNTLGMPETTETSQAIRTFIHRLKSGETRLE